MIASAKKHGETVPRIFTPPLHPLEPRCPETEKWTLGYDFIDFAEGIGVELYPYQKWLAIHALELNADGTFRYRTVIVTVSRQNGKSLFSAVLALFFLVVLEVKNVIGTAQDISAADEVWDTAWEFVEANEVELKPYAARPVLGNGKRAMRWIHGGRWRTKAMNRRAGRAWSVDLLLLDELREQRDFKAWSAVSKTVMARPNALTFGFSNAGDDMSAVLRYLRFVAHKMIGDPDGVCRDLDPAALLQQIVSASDLDEAAELDISDDDDEDLDDLADEYDDGVDETNPAALGWFEWSSAPGSDKTDRDALAGANPALGYGLVTMRSLIAAAATDPDAVFRTECMGLWVESTRPDPPFPESAWENTRIDAKDLRPGEKPPQFAGKVVVALGKSRDATRTHMVTVGRNVHGQVQIEHSRTDIGDAWVRDKLDRVEKVLGLLAVTGQSKGTTVAPLLRALERDDYPVAPWQGEDVTAGTTEFYDDTLRGAFVHLESPALDLAAAHAEQHKLGGGAFLWDRRNSPLDIEPLIAATAGYAVFRSLERDTPARSVYEDEDLVVV